MSQDPFYHNRKVAKQLLERLYDTYDTNVESVVSSIYSVVVRPFCIRRGWNFLSGSGEYYLGPPGKEKLAYHYDNVEDLELHSLIKLLDIEIDGRRGQCIGSYMPNYIGLER